MLIQLVNRHFSTQFPNQFGNFFLIKNRKLSSGGVEVRSLIQGSGDKLDSTALHQHKADKVVSCL